MQPTRAQFGQRVNIPGSQGEDSPTGFKRSHKVAIAAIGFVALAGGLGASFGLAPDASKEAPADGTSATATQPASGSRSWMFLAIPSFGRSPAAGPPSAAQTGIQRGGFGETSRMMSSGPVRGSVGG